MTAVDIKWDIALENAGGFFCEACLGVKTVDERSQDPRYCQSCYDFLTKEAELLLGSKHPAWLPKPEKPSVEPEPVSQKGRKKPVLPVSDIRQLSFEGMGAKAIAPQLRKRNAKVSHKTAQRVLSGERT